MCMCCVLFEHTPTYKAMPLSPHTTHTVIIQAEHFSNSSYCAMEWRNQVKNMQNSQSLKPHIIQQLYHKSQIIPQTYKKCSMLIACNVNTSLQTILQDHGFKQLHHACKWSQDRVAFILQKSELNKRKICQNQFAKINIDKTKKSM